MSKQCHETVNGSQWFCSLSLANRISKMIPFKHCTLKCTINVEMYYLEWLGKIHVSTLHCHAQLLLSYIYTSFWARTCITGGVVPPVCVTDTSLSSGTCGGVVDDDVGEWEPES